MVTICPSRVIFLGINYYWVATDISQSIMYVYMYLLHTHIFNRMFTTSSLTPSVLVCVLGGITCPGSSVHTSQRNEAQDVVTCLEEVWSGPLKSCGGGEWQTTSVLVVLVLNSPCLRVVFTNPLFIIELTKSTVAGTLHRPCTDMMSPDLSALTRS